MNEVHYKICPICGMSMDIEKTECPACGYDGLQTTRGFGRTIVNEQINAIPRPSINLQEMKRKIQEAEEEHAYWQSFRREAAKDAMQGIIAGRHHAGVDPDDVANIAVKCADALIAKLREGNQ